MSKRLVLHREDEFPVYYYPDEDKMICIQACDICPLQNYRSRNYEACKALVREKGEEDFDYSRFEVVNEQEISG